jgi:ribosomal protein L29
MADTKNKAPEVKTIEQLREELVTLRHDYNESRKSHRQGELVNPRVLTVQRRNIARLMTAIKIAETSAVKEDK